MNCQDARLELEAELPRDTRSAVLVAHLERCAACRSYAAQLAAVDTRLGAHFGAFAPRPEFDARLQAAIERAGAAAHEASLVPADAAPLRRRLRIASLIDGGAAVGVAATVLGLALHEHATLARWLEIAASGHVGSVATSGTLVLGSITLALVAVLGAAVVAWTKARAD